MDKTCGCGKGCGSLLLFKILLIIGGLNWGLVGVGTLLGSNWNVVNLLLGGVPTVEAVIYIVVGLSAIVSIFGCSCRACKGRCDACSMGAGNADQQAA